MAALPLGHGGGASGDEPLAVVQKSMRLTYEPPLHMYAPRSTPTTRRTTRVLFDALNGHFDAPKVETCCQTDQTRNLMSEWPGS